jgi:hypothetical protein
VKPNSATPVESAGAAVDELVEPVLSPAALAATIVETRPRERTGRPELTEAAIVVSGGRGTGGDFTVVEAFADSLGAAVGASEPRWTPAGTRTPTRSADRKDGLAAGLHRERDLRRHPAPRRHADRQDHRGGQPRRRGADLRAG